MGSAHQKQHSNWNIKHNGIALAIPPPPTSPTSHKQTRTESEFADCARIVCERQLISQTSQHNLGLGRVRVAADRATQRLDGGLERLDDEVVVALGSAPARGWRRDRGGGGCNQVRAHSEASMQKNKRMYTCCIGLE
jgi:hypothetical protein